ncbi:MAG TPA: TonB family protein [Bryobacteraceae bacterium]
MSAELNLLRPWREPFTLVRLLRDGLGSLAVHVLIVAVILLTPDMKPVFIATPDVEVNLKAAVPLTLPRFYEPTQKDANKTNAIRGLDLRSAVQGQPPARRFRPPSLAPGPPAPAQNGIPTLDAPQIEVNSGTSLPTMTGVGAIAAGPPPPPDRPKLPLDNVTGGTSPKQNSNPANVTSKLDLPKPTPTVPRASVGGRPTVGDLGETAPNITGAPMQAPCEQCSSLQLLSDPQNVDFKPYLQRVLALVKNHWVAIARESARGRRGLVLLQFSIDRQGGVPKVVIASPSGVAALDLAAVAGLSQSSPLPPLPAEYKGDQVRLQMAFYYNLPTQR